MIKLASVATGAMYLPEAMAVSSETQKKNVAKWEIFEAVWKGPAEGNPFLDVTLHATFQQGHRSVEVRGFYDGEGIYKVRFMPDAVGEWTYRTTSNLSALDKQEGSFQCVPASEKNHGPVGVYDVHHFRYADGSKYFPFGTTSYAWIHQSEPLQQQTLQTLARSPFNKLRMCIFPKHYEYNHNEPELYPFERKDGKNDYSRPNPAFYRHLEQCIMKLNELQIEADLILFHPYDRWGYSKMKAEEDDAYLRYAIARLSSFRNVWWSLANEFDLMRAKSSQDFDRMFHVVATEDPYAHLRSIHYSVQMYDYARPYITHASLQNPDFEHGVEHRNDWNKPVVYDEVMYEGNLNRRWGNISGEEMTYRFWRGVLVGCYVSHGETLLDAEAAMDEETTPTLWWSHGGVLRGTSPARIGFLRKIVEGEGNAARGFTPVDRASYSYAVRYQEDKKTAQEVLYFFDLHQPIYYEFPLPEGKFKAEKINPWNMTVMAVPGEFSGKTKIRLTGAPYQAIRFRRMEA